MLVVDGSLGEGGGQILRRFLGRSITCEQVRADAWQVEVGAS